MAEQVDIFRRLFAAADVFRMLTPWKWMGDREVVAVRDPQSGRIAYCVVMGGGGLYFGLEAMLGDRGLAVYRKAVSGEASEKNVMFFN